MEFWQPSEYWPYPLAPERHNSTDHDHISHLGDLLVGLKAIIGTNHRPSQGSSMVSSTPTSHLSAQGLVSSNPSGSLGWAELCHRPNAMTRAVTGDACMMSQEEHLGGLWTANE